MHPEGVLLDERILMRTPAFPTTALTAPTTPAPCGMRRRVESRAVPQIATR